MLAGRVAPLKAELEQLQASISEIGSRLSESGSVITEEESSGLLESIKQWFSDSSAKTEEDFNARLEEARAAAAAAAREETENSFQLKIEQACAEAADAARRESENQIEELRGQLETSRSELATAVATSQPAAPPAADFEAFKAAFEDIDSQRSQSDTLSALVRHAAEFAPRVVFFVIKSGDAVGWKASGFENGLNDETVKLLTVSSQKQTILRDALTGLRIAAGHPQSNGGDASGPLGSYGSPAPERAIAIPLVVFNKPVAVLYADSGGSHESSINTAAAESLTRIAGRTIELLLSRRGSEPARPTVPLSQPSPAAVESSYAAALNAGGKAAGVAIQQPTIQPAIQPTIQPIQQAIQTIQPAIHDDSVRVEPEPKQESWSESQEEAPSRFATEVAPYVEQIAPPAEVAEVAEVIGEVRNTEELPPLASEDLPPVPPVPLVPMDESLRGAEAQLPEPTETESGAPAQEPRRITKEVNETVSDALGGASWIESQAQQAYTTVNEPAAPVPPIAVSEYGIPPVDERQASSGLQSNSQRFAPPPPPPTPPVYNPPTVPTPGSETEQRAHNDARRFARLLVSEIKLYNAAKVNDGRRNYDLYDRLKDEIDRSRKVYDKRAAPAVAARFDYFYDELVQTLAEGDPAKLGKNCPGPVVLA